MPKFARALLIVNPAARTVSTPLVAVIEKALSADLKLDVVHTARRGHATDAAREAVAAGDVDLVVVFSGDGTVNEAVNGLAGTGVALGVLPGGATNILVRALGLPTDPVEATAALIDRAQRGVARPLSLGLADERYFAINCGVGLDAAAMHRLDRRFPSSKGAYDRAAFTSVLREVLGGYAGKEPNLRVRVDDGEQEPALSVMIGRTDPYTYYRGRPIRITPRASLDRGFDVLRIAELPRRRIPALAWHVFRSGGHVEGKGVGYSHDVRRVGIEADTTFPVQVDGDLMADRARLSVSLAEGALLVVA